MDGYRRLYKSSLWTLNEFTDLKYSQRLSGIMGKIYGKHQHKLGQIGEGSAATTITKMDHATAALMVAVVLHARRENSNG